MSFQEEDVEIDVAEFEALVNSGQIEVCDVDNEGKVCYKLTAKGLLVQQLADSLALLLVDKPEALDQITEILADNLA